MTIWQATIEYINTQKINSIIAPHQIIKYCRMCDNDDFELDDCLWHLVKIGILEHYKLDVKWNKNKYKLLCYIRKDLQYREVCNITKNNAWKLWFNDFKQ